MVEIVHELKAQLGERGATFEALRPEIVALGDQKAAFEKVIEVYDPGFELAAPAKARRASRVTEKAGAAPSFSRADLWQLLSIY
jgi:hypothetical protein